ncbi:hypothetical protein LY76DRAFT_49348 [Colletotrichum caudatum]|nr:hypothetical protein LY76DRAFT_49348 [Colletotrichum caudatum]
MWGLVNTNYLYDVQIPVNRRWTPLLQGKKLGYALTNGEVYRNFMESTASATAGVLYTAPLRGGRPDQACLASDLVFAEGVCGTQACQPYRRVLKVLPDRIAIVNGLAFAEDRLTTRPEWVARRICSSACQIKAFCPPKPNRRMPAICCLCRWNLLPHTDCSADTGRLCVQLCSCCTGAVPLRTAI